MIDQLRPYPEYKDSGVPWLRELPRHWFLPRLGALLRERGEVNSDGIVTDVLSVMSNRGVIPYAEKGNVGNKKSEDITRYKIVRPHDIVVNSMNVIIGSVGISRYTGCLSPVYYVLVPRDSDDNPSYFNAYFQTRPFQQSLVRIGNGILAHRMRIPMELLKAEPFPRPPSQEQAAIVRFLDHYDRLIRRYIATKRKLIELLNEQKQAIIHHAVTRGLDPRIRLKPSGVEWLGQVPDHWDVVPLRWHITIGSGDFIESSMVADQRTMSHSHPVIGGNGIMGFTDSVNSTSKTIVIGRVGALCGNVHLVDEAAWITDNALRISAVCGFVPDYLALLLRAMNLNRLANANAQPLITGGMIKAQRAPKPPLYEQIEMLPVLETRLRPLDAALAGVQRELELFREYRTRLVSDVVTGKLDVREASHNLPELSPDLAENEIDHAVLADEVDPAEDKLAVEQITNEYAD